MSATVPLRIRLTGHRVMVGRTGRLDDVRADEAVIPVSEGDMAVIEDRARIHIRVPAVAHELDAAPAHGDGRLASG